MKARFNLVRWILVVTLGCSLGLMLIYVAAWLHPMPDMSGGNNIFVIHQLQRKEAVFRLSEEEMEKELTGVIEAQLAAFRQGDYPNAYKFAAAGIQDQLPLPAFERMVKQAYPFIAQSTSAQFGVILDDGRHAVVNVAIVGASGRARHFQYIMQRESGGWKIGGVMEVKPAGTMI